MQYLVVDASLNGTGIRDKYKGGYIDLEDLHLSLTTCERIRKWLLQYENEHYMGFQNAMLINELDKQGKEIARTVKSEMPDIKIEYFSDALMKIEMI
jgi:hypothetical protein